MAKVAKDIMHPPVYVLEDEDIKEVLEEMVNGEYQELPVVNNKKEVVGDLNCLEIIKALGPVKWMYLFTHSYSLPLRCSSDMLQYASNNHRL